MSKSVYVPNCFKDAGREMRLALANPTKDMPTANFVRTWCVLAYLFPGLHPDGYKDSESNWPRALKRFAAEAWRRADAGELADEELYPSDAQWCGIFDRMQVHLPDETQRRVELAAAFGTPANA